MDWPGIPSPNSFWSLGLDPKTYTSGEATPKFFIYLFLGPIIMQNNFKKPYFWFDNLLRTSDSNAATFPPSKGIVASRPF